MNNCRRSPKGIRQRSRICLSELKVFELQSIADAFGSELDGILPDLEGSVAERLGTAMHNAMSNGVDVENLGFGHGNRVA